MAYATASDLTTVGLPQQALGQLTTQQIAAALDDASTYADSYFRGRYGSEAVPLVAWDSTITRVVAKIAVWHLMIMRGLKPGGPDWEVFRAGYDDATDYLDKVQRQQAHPSVTLRATGLPGSQQPALKSKSIVDLASGRAAPNRGW